MIISPQAALFSTDLSISFSSSLRYLWRVWVEFQSMYLYLPLRLFNSIYEFSSISLTTSFIMYSLNPTANTPQSYPFD
jgi:hypothetical protein